MQDSDPTLPNYDASSAIPPSIEDGAAPPNREEEDNLDEIVMAFDMENGETVCCSFYVAGEEKLYLMEEVKFAGLDVIDTCELTSPALR
jgi:hypothetical protein